MKCVLKAVCVYALLTSLRPLVHRGYVEAFAVLCDVVLAPTFGPGLTASFTAARTNGQDILQVTFRRAGVGHLTLGLEMRVRGFLLVAVFVALGLATPLPWRHRSRGLVVGLVLLHLYMALFVWLELMQCVSDKPPNAGVARVPGRWQGQLQSAVLDAAASPAFSLAVAVLIWGWFFLRPLLSTGDHGMAAARRLPRRTGRVPPAPGQHRSG